MEEKRTVPEFTSAMVKRERIFAVIGLILEIGALPMLLGMAFDRGLLSEEWANFALYATMTVYTVALLWGFLRRDFDALLDRFSYNIFEVFTGYFALMLFNLAVNSLLMTFIELNNPNTDSINDMITAGSGTVMAIVIFLAPIVEETLFRGLIFGSLRKYSRVWAYVFSVVAFAFYHLWGFILSDVRNLIYLVQYIPAGILLCRCYERTNTIWAPIAMHAIVNAVSVSLLQ